MSVHGRSRTRWARVGYSIALLALSVPSLAVGGILILRVRLWLGTWPALVLAALWLLSWFVRPRRQTVDMLVRHRGSGWSRPDPVLEATWNSVVDAVGADRSECRLVVGKGKRVEVCALGDNLVGVTEAALTTLPRSDLEALLALQLGRQLYNTPWAAWFVRWSARPVSWGLYAPLLVAFIAPLLGLFLGAVLSLLSVLSSRVPRPLPVPRISRVVPVGVTLGLMAFEAWLLIPIAGLPGAIVLVVATEAASYIASAVERDRITRAYRLAVGLEVDMRAAVASWLPGRAEDTGEWRWWRTTAPIQRRSLWILEQRLCRSEPVS